MGARGRLGVILHGKNRVIDRGQSFNRVIIQTEMRHQNLTERCFDDRQLCRHLTDRMGHGDSKIVVLRRDLDSSRAEIHDRMVRPMMAELQLIRLKSQRETENLMP